MLRVDSTEFLAFPFHACLFFQRRLCLREGGKYSKVSIFPQRGLGKWSVHSFTSGFLLIPHRKFWSQRIYYGRSLSGGRFPGPLLSSKFVQVSRSGHHSDDICTRVNKEICRGIPPMNCLLLWLRVTALLPFPGPRLRHPLTSDPRVDVARLRSTVSAPPTVYSDHCLSPTSSSFNSQGMMYDN